MNIGSIFDDGMNYNLYEICKNTAPLWPIPNISCIFQDVPVVLC